MKPFLFLVFCLSIISSNIYSQICVINNGQPIQLGTPFSIRISNIEKYDEKLSKQKIIRLKIITPVGIYVEGEDFVNVRNADNVTFNLNFNNYSLNKNDSIKIVIYGYSVANRVASVFWRSTVKYPLALTWSITSFLALFGGQDITEEIMAMNEALWAINRPHYLRRSTSAYNVGELFTTNTAFTGELNSLPISKKREMVFDINSEKVLVETPLDLKPGLYESNSGVELNVFLNKTVDLKYQGVTVYCSYKTYGDEIQIILPDGSFLTGDILDKETIRIGYETYHLVK